MEILLIALAGALVGTVLLRLADALYRRYALPFAPHVWRAPLVVLASAILSALLYARFGASARFALAALYSAVFLLVFITDLEHRLIFNVVILPATMFAVLVSPLSHLGVARALLGGALACALVWLIYVLGPLYARLRRRDIDVPFGFGDVKLAGFMGIVVGFPAAFDALIAAILLGGVGAIFFLAIQFARTRKIALEAAIPYGPFFCAAGWWFMAFG